MLPTYAIVVETLDRPNNPEVYRVYQTDPEVKLRGEFKDIRDAKTFVRALLEGLSPF